jgi:hypothetical protein
MISLGKCIECFPELKANIPKEPPARVRRFTLNGRTKTLNEWCKEKNIPLKTAQERIRLGWGLEKALSTEKLCAGRRGAKITYHGVTRSIREWAKELNVCRETLSQRIKKFGQEAAIEMGRRKKRVDGTRK